MTRAVITHGPRPDAAADVPDIDMSTWLAGLELPSPVLTASGCAAAGRELDQGARRLEGVLGAIETLGWVWGPIYGAVLVRFLAWNMPYHAEHHLFPNIAFHNLPEAHRHLRPPR